VQFQNISILPPTEGIGISWGVGGSGRPKVERNVSSLTGISSGAGRC